MRKFFDPLGIEIVAWYDKTQEKELKYSTRRHPAAS
jgi:hypothetical protein